MRQYDDNVRRFVCGVLSKRGDELRRSITVFFAGLVAAGGVFAVGVVEAQAGPYSRVVDDTSEDGFEAGEGWGAGSYGKGVRESSYRFARASSEPSVARFEVEVPESGRYSVYVRWPDVGGLSDSVPVGVQTGSGEFEWTRVNQQKDGGRWVRVGMYDMEAGDSNSVVLSRETGGSEGYVAADAVKVEKAPEKPASTKGQEERSARKATPSEGETRRSTETTSRTTSKKGQQVLEEAREWLGVRYKLGGATRRGIDCSGLTMMVYKSFGVSLPHWDAKQYRMGQKVPKGQEQPGDLVFFNEHGDGISHVGIYAGKGRILHASDYFNKVVESDMKYIKGYVGARRFV